LFNTKSLLCTTFLPCRKIQRDMAERGHSLDSIKKSIEARKPDFDAYIDPQKKHADMIIQVRLFECSLCVLDKTSHAWPRQLGQPSTEAT
jgi:uridine kinase